MKHSAKVNRTFKYIPADSTDISKRFQRVRRLQLANEKERELKVEELKQPTRRAQLG